MALPQSGYKAHCSHECLGRANHVGRYQPQVPYSDSREQVMDT